MIRNILQKQYDFELEQRNSITSSTNIPIVALTILGGALSSLLIGFHYSNNITTYVFVVILSLSVFSMFFSLYCVVRTFLGYSWQKIPSAQSLVSHLEDLEDWHHSNGEESEIVPEKAKEDFNIYFNERLSEAADHNSENNIKRGNYLHGATAALTIAFVFLVLSTPFYIYQKAVKVTEVYKVKIVNELKLRNEEKGMSENTDSGNKSNTQQAKPEAAPASKPTVSQKPTGPRNIVFKGSVGSTSVRTVGPSGSKSTSGKVDVSSGTKNTNADTGKK